MPFYPDSETLYDVVKELFHRLEETPGATTEFARSRMVIDVHLTEPSAYINLNARTNPVSFRFEPDGTSPDLTLTMSADTLHNVWMGRTRLRDAFFRGRIKTKGSIARAMQLASLFRQAEALYPQVLRDKGMI